MNRINRLAESLAGLVFFCSAVCGVAGAVQGLKSPGAWILLSSTGIVSFVVFVFSRRMSEALAWTSAVGLIYVIAFSLKLASDSLTSN